MAYAYRISVHTVRFGENNQILGESVANVIGFRHLTSNCWNIDILPTRM